MNYTWFPVLSPDKFNVSCEQFHQKDGLHIQSVASVCMCCILWMAQSIQCSARSLLCLPCGLCIKSFKELQAPKHHAQMHTESEYSHLAQLDSGFGVTLHYHHRPSPLWTVDSQYLSPGIVSYHQEPNRILHTDGRWKWKHLDMNWQHNCCT